MAPKSSDQSRLHSDAPPRKNRFLSILLRLGILLLLLTPLYLALASYTYEKNKVVVIVETYYTSLELQGPTGFSVSASGAEPAESDKALLLPCFSKMLENATRTPAVPDTHTTSYRVTMYKNTGESETFNFFFSPDSATAYYGDLNGNLWQTRGVVAEAFLNSIFAFEIYPSAIPPTLTTKENDAIIPSELSWSYRTQKGDFADLTHLSTTTETLVYGIVNDVGFDFSLQPSRYTVVIRRGETVSTFASSDHIQLPPLNIGEVLDVEIKAFYDSISSLPYCGTAVYRFQMKVVVAADFSLDAPQKSAGDFFLLTCKNVADINKLAITAEPALGSAPILFQRGELVYAAIPAGEGNRKLTVTYGTTNVHFDLTVTPIQSTRPPLASDALRGNWDGLFDGTLDKLIDQLAADSDSALLTPKKLFLTPGGTQMLAFGDQIALSTTAQSPLELYRTSGTVTALSAGIVKAVGQNELLGNYVIVDHGCGIYTWYCGLAEIHVGVGDPVAVGKTSLGLAGKTGLGLAHEDSVVVLATLGKALLSPACLREHAVTLP